MNKSTHGVEWVELPDGPTPQNSEDAVILRWYNVNSSYIQTLYNHTHYITIHISAINMHHNILIISCLYYTL